MNLHDVRVSFESRVASIEKETSYLLGKLALVSEAQKIAAQIGGASPVSPEVSGESTGSFSQTVTALPASEPVAPAPVAAKLAEPVVEAAPEPAVSVTPAAPVEEPSSYSNVAQFVPTPAPAAKAEPEPQIETATAAPAAEVVAEEPEAAAVEEPEAAVEEAEVTLEEPSLDARVDQVLAEFEQEAIAQTAGRPVVEAEEPADEVELAEAEVEARVSEDSSENTAELEKLEMPEAVEAEAEASEAEEAEPEAKADALASLRAKLASAAAEEPPKSPFLTLGKFLNRAK